MTAVRERGGVGDVLEARGEPGWAELGEALRALLDGADPAVRVIGVQQLKAKVYRLQLDAGAPWSSVVVKRLEPAVAHRTQLVAQRWLPALGLGDRCARLLGVAGDRAARLVWHVYEDLGDDTLAARPTSDRVRATVDLVAEFHTRAARHPVLPDVRRYGEGFGIQYFTANVADAIAALEGLAASGIEPPPEHAGVTARLLERLRGLTADTPRRARAFERAAGPDTLLHGDLWTINAFVAETTGGGAGGRGGGPRARLVDWDKVGVGPFSYDLSTFLFRFPPAERPWVLEYYRKAVTRAGWRLAPARELQLLFDTAERARYANRLIWPALALLQERADWGFPELAEVERWFRELDRCPSA